MKSLLQLGKFYSPERGGMESHLQGLCEGVNTSYDLKVIVANSSFTTKTEFINGVNVTRAASAGLLRSNSICLSMPSCIDKHPADIVHIHFPNPMAHIAYLFSKQKGKLVITWHSDIIRQKKLLKIYKPLLERILQRADRIIVTSENYLKHSPQLKGFQSKCVAIPLGISLKRFEKNGAVRQSADSIKRKFAVEEPLLLFVGRFANYKGLTYLIEAMKTVKAKLILAGSGPEHEKLVSKIEETGTSERVVLCGDIPDDKLPAYFHACDIFILPSTERSEAFGIVQLEAFACGKPVISTDLATGVPYVNQNGKTGIIVSPKDPSVLAEAINQLLKNKERRVEFGQNALARVEKEFTLKRMVDKTLAVYKELL